MLIIGGEKEVSTRTMLPKSAISYPSFPTLGPSSACPKQGTYANMR